MVDDFQSQVPFDWNTRKKYLDLPFPISEYERRIDKIRRAMERKDIDCLLIFGDAGDSGDLVYVSNFIPFGRAAILIPRENEPVVITDAILHGEPINSYAWMTWIKDYTPVKQGDDELASAIAKVLNEEKSKKLGIVGKNNFPFSIWEKLKSLSEFSWVDFSLDFTILKSVRSDLEVALCKEVGAITADAMKEAVESMRPGMKEIDVVACAQRVMFERGAHDRSFQTIVNSGPRGGLKHSYPTSRKIEKGDLVYLDMGAMRFGYQADMSRSVVLGGANTEQKEVLDTVLEGYSVLTKMMRPGVRTSELIEEAHRIEDKSQLRSKYKNRIYLGLIVHHAIATSFFEIPSLGLPDTVLEKNMSFAFEPMAHILDFGTAVIEDTLLITSGGQESLTPFELVHW